MLTKHIISRVHTKKILQFRFSSTDQYQKFQSINDQILYEGHRPLSLVQKSLMAVGSAFAGVSNPYRSDMVAALGETLFPEGALRKMQLTMLKNESGRQILKEKPIIDTTSLDTDKLITLPKNTLGYAYAAFMTENKISSDARDPVHYIDDAELAYIMKRYRQIHDFVHLFLGMNVTVPEEVIVKWFEWAHFGLPMTMVSAIFGPLATTPEERRQIQKYIPWALYNGLNSSLILNVYFEKEIETDFNLLKKRLNIIDRPSF